MSVLEQLEKDIKNIKNLKAEKYAKEDGLANNFANELGQGELKTAQLRKIFASIKELERGIRGRKGNDKDFNKEKLFLLLPEVAYAVGRKVAPKNFYDVIKWFVEKIEDVEDIKKFISFFEATISYRKMKESMK